MLDLTCTLAILRTVCYRMHIVPRAKLYSLPLTVYVRMGPMVLALHSESPTRRAGRPCSIAIRASIAAYLIGEIPRAYRSLFRPVMLSILETTGKKSYNASDFVYILRIKIPNGVFRVFLLRTKGPSFNWVVHELLQQTPVCGIT